MKLKTEIDRPFRSKAALEFEKSLIAQYRDIANPDLKSGNTKAKAKVQPPKPVDEESD